MLGSNRFTDFFARMPSAPPPSPRKERRPWSAEDLFKGPEVVRTLGDTGRTFSESVCEQLGLHPNQYENVVFQRCLYRKARLLRPLLKCYNRNFFAPDRDFIRRVGKSAGAKNCCGNWTNFIITRKTAPGYGAGSICAFLPKAREIGPGSHARTRAQAPPETAFRPRTNSSAGLGLRSAKAKKLREFANGGGGLVPPAQAARDNNETAARTGSALGSTWPTS